MRPLEARRQRLVRPSLDLVLDHELKERQVPELLLLRLIEAQLDRLQHAAELEPLEPWLELERVHPLTSPVIALGP